ncbi:hypothetical protein PspLS_01634 [Pyricularia sp. CBS 133598]|nr:hypothetical protein PspLS_01634 [Pyricularia sp. CBS 133598]
MVHAKPDARLACDSCYGLKTRCVFTGAGCSSGGGGGSGGATLPSCQRCARLGRPCVTTRTRGESGRPRKPDRTSTRPVAGRQFVWTAAGSAPFPKRNAARIPSTEGGGVAILPPSSSSSLLPSAAATPSPSTIQPSDHVLASLSTADRTLLGLILDRRTFADHFVLASPFADGMIEGMVRGLGMGLPQQKQPSPLVGLQLACAAKVADLLLLCRRNTADAEADDGYYGYYSKSAAAVNILRQTSAQARVVGEAEALVAIYLGIGVVTFDLMDAGRSAHSVARFAIGVVRRAAKLHLQRRRHTFSPGVDRDLVPLAYLDTCNCLVRRMVPAARLEVGGPPGVDRYIGVCGSLLPVLYDICELSRDLRALQLAKNTAGKDDLGSGCRVGRMVQQCALQQRQQRLHRALEDWQPALPGNFGTAYTPAEQAVMHGQARIHKLTATLILHRLAVTFDQDGGYGGRGPRLAAELLRRMTELYTAAGRYPKEERAGVGTFDYRLSLSLVVAAAELTSAGDRRDCLEVKFPLVVSRLYPEVDRMLREFVGYVWARRDDGFGSGINTLPTPTYGDEQGAFIVCTETHINAPASAIYNALLDFEAYSTWSSFVIDIDPAPALEDVQIGLTMRFTTQGIVPDVNTTSIEVVTAMDDRWAQGYMLAAWRSDDEMGGAVLRAEHPTLLLDGGDGTVIAVSWDTYYFGPGIPALLPFKESIQNMFDQQGTLTIIDLLIFAELHTKPPITGSRPAVITLWCALVARRLETWAFWFGRAMALVYVLSRTLGVDVNGDSVSALTPGGAGVVASLVAATIMEAAEGHVPGASVLDFLSSLPVSVSDIVCGFDNIDDYFAVKTTMAQAMDSWMSDGQWMERGGDLLLRVFEVLDAFFPAAGLGGDEMVEVYFGDIWERVHMALQVMNCVVYQRRQLA